MKVCPVCKARAFDDMEVCYGCLHRFGEEASAPGEKDARLRSNASAQMSHGKAPESDARGEGGAAACAQAPASAAPTDRLPVVQAQADAATMPIDVGTGGRKQREPENQPVARNLILTIPVPEGATGVKVAVDFGSAATLQR